MLKRLRPFFALLSLGLLLGLIALWASGAVIIVREVRFGDERSHLFIAHGGLQIDYTGLHDLFRDLSTSRVMSVSIASQTALPAFEANAVTADGWMTFRQMSEYTQRTPLQDLFDSAGRPISIDQTSPLKLVTLPLWVIFGLLAIAPTRLVARWRSSPSASYHRLQSLNAIRHAFVPIITVVAIVTGGLWTFSAIRTCGFVIRTMSHSLEFQSCNGGLSYYAITPDYWFQESGFPGGCGFYTIAGQHESGTTIIAPLNYRPRECFAIPYWMLFVVTVTAPFTWLAMRLWGRREKAGHCISCGYDLRENTDRCPECGWSRETNGSALASALRRQRIVFAIGSAFLLVGGAMCIAWTESAHRTLILLNWFNAKRRDSTMLAVDKGMIHASLFWLPSTGYGSPIMPAWPAVAGLFLIALYLAWTGRQIGRAPFAQLPVEAASA